MRKSDFPIEYKKGFVEFLNCKIDLSKRVLIPRIETEFWVERTINEIKRTEVQPLYVLDMFAGSGCIGIAILKNIKNSRVNFVDFDKKAIEQIKINLRINKISKKRYRVFKSNLFEKLKRKQYEFIFANPPYLAKERLKEADPSVLKYEPKIAVLAGKKGMFYIKEFLKEVKFYLKRNGIIFLEFDPNQKNDIANILKQEGYKKFKFFKDQFKKYRWLKIST